jgi:hypothetical protein
VGPDKLDLPFHKIELPATVPALLLAVGPTFQPPILLAFAVFPICILKLIGLKNKSNQLHYHTVLNIKNYQHYSYFIDLHCISELRECTVSLALSKMINSSFYKSPDLSHFLFFFALLLVKVLNLIFNIIKKARFEEESKTQEL